MRRTAAWALLLCVAVPGGCVRPAVDATWFPRVPGAVWVYELRTAQGRTEVRVEALGERELPGRGVRVFLVEETRTAGGGDGLPEGFDPVNPVGYVVEEGYLARLPGLVYDGSGRLRVLGDGPATRVLPLDPRPGARWTQDTRPFAAAGEDALQRWEGEVRARGAVHVPAGRFGDVVEVRTTLRDAAGRVHGRYRDVFARDVGLVYGEARGPGARAGSGDELRLLRYHVPTASGAGSASPPGASVRAASRICSVCTDAAARLGHPPLDALLGVGLVHRASAAGRPAVGRIAPVRLPPEPQGTGGVPVRALHRRPVRCVTTSTAAGTCRW